MFAPSGPDVFHLPHCSVGHVRICCPDIDNPTMSVLHVAAAAAANCLALTSALRRIKVSSSGTAILAYTMEAVPVVDLALPVEQTAEIIGRAARKSGFFYVKNHGVSEDLLLKGLLRPSTCSETQPQNQRREQVRADTAP